MRIEQLTFTRFIAAFLIVIFHYGLDIFPFNALKPIFSEANVGVSYFFILSGFVMIIAYHKKEKINFWEYLRNRFARIYPVYFLALFLLITYYLLATNLKINVTELLLNTTLLQSWIPGYALTLNFPGWSLSVELFFYMCFPIVFNKIYKNISLKKLSVYIISFYVISQIIFLYFQSSSFNKGLHTWSNDLLFYSPYLHLNEFLLGNLAAIFFVKNYDKLKKGNKDVLLILLIILCSFLLYIDIPILNYHNGLLGLLFIPIIILTSINTGLISKISKSKFCIHLGEISYGVYILQIPIYTFTRRLFIYFGITDKTTIFIGFIVALLASSSITYKYFETPLRNYIKQFKVA